MANTFNRSRLNSKIFGVSMNYEMACKHIRMQSDAASSCESLQMANGMENDNLVQISPEKGKDIIKEIFRNVLHFLLKP